MKTIIGKITIDILTSIYQPFWFAILLSIMTMFFYLYVKCPEGAGKGWKAAIRTWIVHFKRDREFRKKYILFFYITMVLFKTLINRDMWMNPLCDVWGVWGIYRYNTVTGQRILTSECIENFFLLMPYIILMFWNFEEKIFGKKVYIGKIILKSIQIAFLSSLTIECCPAQEGAKIYVSDTGCGMPKGELDKITEAFYRVDKSRSRKQGGVGLGLALCKEIVRIHKGDMEFISQEEKGTTAIITIGGGHYEKTD